MQERHSAHPRRPRARALRLARLRRSRHPARRRKPYRNAPPPAPAHRRTRSAAQAPLHTPCRTAPRRDSQQNTPSSRPSALDSGLGTGSGHRSEYQRSARYCPRSLIPTSPRPSLARCWLHVSGQSTTPPPEVELTRQAFDAAASSNSGLREFVIDAVAHGRRQHGRRRSATSHYRCGQPARSRRSAAGRAILRHGCPKTK